MMMINDSTLLKKHKTIYNYNIQLHKKIYVTIWMRCLITHSAVWHIEYREFYTLIYITTLLKTLVANVRVNHRN